MSTASLLAFAALPVVVSAIALGAYAQSQAPAAEPVAARDKAMVEAAFSQADTSGDGKLTPAEVAQHPVLAGRFESLDTDHDGRLDLAEFALTYVEPK